MKEIALRDYQQRAVDTLRDGYRNGHRSQLLVAPTGAGKTLMSASLMAQARERGTKTAFVVDRVALVDQTSAVLDAYGISHGVIQAGHWRRHGYEPIQVCSAQTLEKRGFFPDLSLLVVDEAHAVRKETANLISNMGRLKVLGLTATPFTKGLSKLYSNLVNVTTTDALTKDGFLVPLKIYAAVAPDMTGAKVVAGEWSDKDIEKRGLAIVGDIVKEWEDKTEHHFGGAVKTIVFSATVDHGAELCRKFNAAGYRFEQISYKDGSDDRRRELIAEFRKPDSKIVGLVSCEVFTKGFDVPDVLCGISARPYRKSFSSHIQQLGRVLRPSQGKSFALWLCHSGNVLRFHSDTLELFANGVSELDGGKLDDKPRKEPDQGDKDAIKCAACGYVLPPRADHCPACGHERKRKSIEEAAGTMVMVGGKEIPAIGRHAFLAHPQEVWAQLVFLALDRKHGDVGAAQRFAQAQYRNIYGAFARKTVANTTPMDPSHELTNLVRSNIIRWAKSRPRGDQGAAAAMASAFGKARSAETEEFAYAHDAARGAWEAATSPP